MSVRVNLLPQEIEERNERRRELAGLGVAGVVLLALLAGAYVWQRSQVADAQAALDEAQAEVASREQELATLVEFEELQQRSTAAEALLVAALGDEVSFAGILQDVAAVFPPDAELSSLAINLRTDADAEEVLGAVRRSIGDVALVGRTTAGHAPGVERLLLELAKVAAFDNIYFSQATTDNADATSFTVELDLGEEARTQRYVDGLPEELR